MNFTSVRLITADFERLVGFYEKISGQPFTRATPSFGELHTSGATLAIGDTSTLAPFGGEYVASPAANRTAILEFRVADVCRCRVPAPRPPAGRSIGTSPHYHAVG